MQDKGLAERRSLADGGRTNVVLVPGFVGFDALGQLGYYAGTNIVFDEWLAESRRASLHYFDNFPTASVPQRARRLLVFLAKKCVRGEFGREDRVALVGHSTGGLDIRKAFYDLVESPGETLVVDGRCEIKYADILARIKRICFLSVPHYGTNLADFGCQFAETLKSSFKAASVGLALNREPIAKVRRLLAGIAPRSRSSLILAIYDALNESDGFVADPRASYDERESRAQLSLWLEHMSRDFQILDDLRSAAADATPESPAHFTQARRAKELAAYRSFDIRTRSYATTAPGAAGEPASLVGGLLQGLKSSASLLNLGFSAARAGARLWLAPALSIPALLTLLSAPGVSALGALGAFNSNPRLLFEIFAAACADPNGPFQRPETFGEHAIAPSVTDFVTGKVLPTASLDKAENDGVVNTISMLWPYDPARSDAHSFSLVKADHGEIIGHYAPLELPNAEPSGRRYYAYDFFQSGTDFDGEQFRSVWRDVFDFCVA